MSWQRLKDKKLQKNLQTRSKILALIRQFFLAQGFFEAETPILAPAAGQEPYLNPLKTSFQDEQGKNYSGYLITSPEYSHKKLLAAGFGKTFEITRSFRGGEPWSDQHNPEFTILEWYRAGVGYKKIMDDVEAMVSYVVLRLKEASPASSKVKSQKSNLKFKIKNLKFDYQNHVIDLTLPWERISMQEAWEKYAGVEKHAPIYDRKLVRELCLKRGYTVGAGDSYDNLFFKIFLTEIEPRLGQGRPTILYDYPASMAALARLKSPVKFPSLDGRGEGRVRPQLAERFEVYIAGLEIANAFSELNDAKEQKKRFLQEQKLRQKLGKETIPLDQDFLAALGKMPPAAGIALGVDRLAMLLTDSAKIEDVLTFPASDIFRV